MSKNYIVDCYTCQHNGQETCKGCNTLLVGEDEPYENWQLREDLETKDQRIAELEEQLKNAIVPKFKIGQEVFYVVDKYSPVLSGEILEIQIWDLKKDNIIYVIEYSGNVHCESVVFETLEEAQAKLEELRENK